MIQVQQSKKLQVINYHVIIEILKKHLICMAKIECNRKYEHDKISVPQMQYRFKKTVNIGETFAFTQTSMFWTS